MVKKFVQSAFLATGLLLLARICGAEPLTGSAPEGIDWGGVTGFLLAYVTGIGISFTPCVWPIYPITSSVIINSASVKTKKMALILSLTYVLGLAVTYTILGAVTGKLGEVAANYLKSSWMVILVSLFFFVFGLSMLGLFEIQMPSSISSRLMSGKKKGFIGIFLMGLVSGLVLSPCITPVVGAFLAYVMKSGSWVTGAILFFAFSLGMGTILVVIGTISGALKVLPKPGKWMVRVKQVFGVIMILVAGYLAWPVLAPSVEKQPTQPPQEKKGSEASPKASPGKRASIQWMHDFEKGLEKAREEDKPMMVDFTAEWCAACKTLDKETFPHKLVVEESGRFVTIKFDATAPDAQQRQILKEYKIVGFPTILFIDTQGNSHPVLGFRPPGELVKIMKEIK